MAIEDSITPITEELKPVYDKEITTYYGQALITHSGNDIILKSYGQKVITVSGTKAVIHSCRTKAQERHIREFLKQNNFEVGKLETRRQLLERYKY